MKILKKTLKAIALILVTVILLHAVCLLIPRSYTYAGENPMRKDGELPILIAHGGGNREFPDNTLEAFYNAYSVDKNMMIETDASITADGVLILSHDTTLDRKTNVTGNISDWNYSDLISERVNFGYTNPTKSGKLNGDRKIFKTDDGKEVKPTDVSYPEGISARDSEVYLATTLEDILVAFPETRISVEIKQEGELAVKAIKEAVRVTELYDAFDRVVFASFHDEVYEEYKAMLARGEVPEEFMFSPSLTSAITFFVMQLLGVDFLFNDRISALQLPTEEYGIKVATKTFVERAQARNISVQFWTVNDPDEMRELIEMGVDGIMTDYPHLLAEILAEYEAE